MITNIVSIIFTIYSWLLIIRIFMSWFPIDQNNEFVRQLCKITDPYLELFRKIIPPIGMIDISPIAAIMVLEVVKSLIFRFLPY